METISNKDKAKNMTRGFLKEGLIKKSRIQELLIKAMDWKDKQHAKEKQQLIDEACEWWKNELTYPTMTQTEIDWYQTKIAEFKKAMEGER